jgi:hypothetical protein
LSKIIEVSPDVESWLQGRALVDLFCRPSEEPEGIWAFQYRESKRQTVSYSRSLLFGAAMAERNSECTGFLSQGTRGTLERSRDGFDARFIS